MGMITSTSGMLSTLRTAYMTPDDRLGVASLTSIHRPPDSIFKPSATNMVVLHIRELY